MAASDEDSGWLKGDGMDVKSIIHGPDPSCPAVVDGASDMG